MVKHSYFLRTNHNVDNLSIKMTAKERGNVKVLKIILSFIPLIGTSLGAFSAASKQFKRFQEEEETLVAVATGILAAITLKLFTEATSYIEQGQSLVFGVLLGMAFITIMNWLVQKKNLNTRDKIFWAMLMHNLPEGMLIGISLANASGKLATFSIIMGITIQNLMDGFVVSMPLISSKGAQKAVWLGVLSGAIEPLASTLIIVAVGATSNVQFLEPLLIGFSFSAILMIVVELWEECWNKKIVVVSGILAALVNFILG